MRLSVYEVCPEYPFRIVYFVERRERYTEREIDNIQALNRATDSEHKYSQWSRSLSFCTKELVRSVMNTSVSSQMWKRFAHTELAVCRRKCFHICVKLL